MHADIDGFLPKKAPKPLTDAVRTQFDVSRIQYGCGGDVLRILYGFSTDSVRILGYFEGWGRMQYGCGKDGPDEVRMQQDALRIPPDVVRMW